MTRNPKGPDRLRFLITLLAVVAMAGAITAFAEEASEAAPGRAQGIDQDADPVLRGRELVIQYDCGGCHGGMDDPRAEGWLAGLTSPAQEFLIGPCAWEPGATPCYRTRPRNLTPDNTTGLGRFSERQIFNALRYGLRPGETADVEITSSTPGEGNFPANPKYLAPPMPWAAFRHMPDENLRAIAAYLKRGLEPVSNRVPDSEGPMDFWVSEYTPEKYGTLPAPDFPTAREREPTDPDVDMDEIMRGRQLVLQNGCGDCHGGFANPSAEGFLAGVTEPAQVFPMGPCLEDPDAPCFMMRPRNLTADEETGIGAFSARQIFNVLRHGLRPSGTPDVEITADNFPEDPDYLAPGMVWIWKRHLPDEDIWAMAAYLKNAIRPVHNVVEDTDRPDDGWASAYAEGMIGTYPAPPFPTANEVGG